VEGGRGGWSWRVVVEGVVVDGTPVCSVRWSCYKQRLVSFSHRFNACLSASRGGDNDIIRTSDVSYGYLLALCSPSDLRHGRPTSPDASEIDGAAASTEDGQDQADGETGPPKPEEGR